MKAIVFDRRNSPEPFVLRDVEKPSPGPQEVLVKIVAVSANAADYRSMKMNAIPKRKIFGSDIAGRVEAVGNDTSLFAVGDAVVGDLSSFGFGGFAEYVAVPERALSLKPAGIPFETAAALPMAAVTALQALRNQGNIRSGQKVMIFGSGGGVGTFAVQLAKYFGAEVTAVCGEKNVSVMHALGADHVINYRESDFTRNSPVFDLVLAVNGNNPLKTYKRLLAPDGIFVMVGGALSQVFKTILLGSMLSMGRRKMRFLAAKTNKQDLEWIMKLVEEGKIKPVIDRHYPLAETADAIRYLSKGHALGKVMIDVAVPGTESEPASAQAVKQLR